MAVIYIPDALNVEVHTRANEDAPDLGQREAMKRRNLYMKVAIREKLDRDGGGNART